MDGKYSIAIVTQDRKEFLALTLLSVINQTTKPERIVIYDNSIESSVSKSFCIRQLLELIAEKDIDLIIKRCKRKLGALIAKNRVLKFATNPVVLLDDDTILEPDCAKKLLKALKYDYAVSVRQLPSNEQELNDFISLDNEEEWKNRIKKNIILRQYKSFNGIIFYKPVTVGVVLFKDKDKAIVDEKFTPPFLEMVQRCKNAGKGVLVGDAVSWHFHSGNTDKYEATLFEKLTLEISGI